MLNYNILTKLICDYHDEEVKFLRFLEILEFITTPDSLIDHHPLKPYHHHGTFYKMEGEWDGKNVVNGMLNAYAFVKEIGFEKIECDVRSRSVDPTKAEQLLFKELLNPAPSSQFTVLEHIYQNRHSVWYSHYIDTKKEYDNSDTKYPNVHWSEMIAIHHGRLAGKSLWNHLFRFSPVGIITKEDYSKYGKLVRYRDNFVRDHPYLTNSAPIPEWTFITNGESVYTKYCKDDTLIYKLLTESRGFLSKSLLDRFLKVADCYTAFMEVVYS